MSVTVIRPELTEEEREQRLQAVDAAVVRFFRAIQAAEKKSAPEKKTERSFKKTCTVCGEDFVSGSAHTKYCPDCREAAYTANKLAYSARKYQKVREAIKKKYEEGIVYVCDCCGKKIRVHERTTRKTCDACLIELGGEAVSRMRLRKPINEEVVEDV